MNKKFLDIKKKGWVKSNIDGNSSVGRTFEKFINLLEQGKIRITFKVSIYKKGKKKGKNYDHGTGFDIKEEDLLQLYIILLYNQKFFVESLSVF